MIRRHRVILVLALLLAALALAHIGGVAPIALVSRLELLLDDIRLRAFAPTGRSSRIVIVDIDDKSLAALGRWPWSRQRMAELVDALFARQRVAAVGFDFGFSEPESATYEALADLAASDPRLAPHLPAWRAKLDHDARFAAALAQRPVVLGYYFSNDRGGQRAGELPDPVFSDAEFGGLHARLPPWNGYGANIASLAQAAPRAGFFNALPDEDGVTRSLPIVARFEGRYYQGLALALWRMAARSPSMAAAIPAASAPVVDAGVFDGTRPIHEALRPIHTPAMAAPGLTDLVAVVIGDGPGATRLALDRRGAVRVPFRAHGGPKGDAFAYFSAADVLQGHVADGTLAGRIVLIGSSAPGLADLRATPIHAALPGVEVHANLLAGLLEGRVPLRPDWAPGVEATATAVTLVATALLVILAPAGLAVAAFALLIAALIAANLWAYRSAALVLPLALPLLAGTLLFAVGLAQGYVREWRARRTLTSMFGSYVPPEVVRKMARDGMRHDMHAENRELTLLFCDLRGFSRIAETLEPQALRTLINLYLSTMSATVRAHQGTLDKFIGDAVMAFWGAPIDDAQHARHAVQAALAMADAVAPLNTQLRERGLPELGVGIGLATGTVCVGDLGSDLRRSYTAVGDAVNIASRIEALTRVYGIDLLLAESTREACGEACGDGAGIGHWLEVDRLQVKGREKLVTIFTILSSASGATSGLVPLLRHWELALAAERSHHWQAARKHLSPLLAEPSLPPRLQALILWLSQRIDEGIARQAAPGNDPR